MVLMVAWIWCLKMMMPPILFLEMPKFSINSIYMCSGSSVRCKSELDFRRKTYSSLLPISLVLPFFISPESLRTPGFEEKWYKYSNLLPNYSLYISMQKC
jgi:hypothetical protein